MRLLTRLNIFLFLCLLAFSACGSKKEFVKQDVVFPVKVAVLPFANETNDVTAVETVRKALAQYLPLRGYEVQNIEQTSEILVREFGVTDGGQLPSVTPKELGEILGVEGLFYGNVLKFVDLPLGVVRNRKVEAEFKLIDVKTQELFWEKQDQCSVPEIYLSAEEAKIAFALQVGERQIEKMTGNFLKLESEMMALYALKSLPQSKLIGDQIFSYKIEEKQKELKDRKSLKDTLRRSLINKR